MGVRIGFRLKRHKPEVMDQLRGGVIIARSAIRLISVVLPMCSRLFRRSESAPGTSYLRWLVKSHQTAPFCLPHRVFVRLIYGAFFMATVP